MGIGHQMLDDRRFWSESPVRRSGGGVLAAIGLAVLLAGCGNSAGASDKKVPGDLFSGTWTGRLEGTGKAVIAPRDDGSYHVELSVETTNPPCMGGLDGRALFQGGKLVLSHSEYGKTCYVTMTPHAQALEVEEDGCLAFHGLSCAFNGTLTRSGASSARRPETSARGSAVQPRPDKPDKGEVAVTIPAGDGQMANCALGEVAGLDPRGDGFLAVRAGPGTNYRELNRLYNGQKVLLCDGRGDWKGIVYPADSPGCNTEGARPRQIPYDGPCRSGWVHGRWVELLAG